MEANFSHNSDFFSELLDINSEVQNMNHNYNICVLYSNSRKKSQNCEV